MITHINPVGSMDLLSQLEVDRLKQTASSDIYQLFRNCSLAVLNSGSHRQLQRDTGTLPVLRYSRDPARARVKLELFNAPSTPSSMARSSAASRSTSSPCCRTSSMCRPSSESNRLGQPDQLHPSPTWCSPSCATPKRSCRGGSQPGGLLGRPLHQRGGVPVHPRSGSELGLRELNICTGCGPGAMEGPHEGSRRRPRQAAGCATAAASA